MGKTVSAVLSQLKKKHSEAFVEVSEAGTIQRFQLESPQMNYLFGGGFPKGRIMEFFGPESSGKSSISTYLAIQNQRYNTERPMVVYIDFERTFDNDHAIELGLDTSEDMFLMLQPDSGEEAFEICKELLTQLPIGVVVWDSIGATPSRSQMEDAFRACVSPDTELDFIGKTINDLFLEAGYDYHTMEPNMFYPVQKDINVASLDTHTGEIFYDRVLTVVYKGMSKGYTVNYGGTSHFKCTKLHKFYDAVAEKFRPAEELYPSFIGVDKNNRNIEITLEPCDEEFPVLDMEIENNHTYLSDGILSHNTYGGTANVMSAGLKFINPTLARTGTTLIFINQERAQIGGYSPVPGATTTSGGFARKFFASSRNRVTKVETLKEGNEPVGIRMKIRNVKSKIGVPFREALIDLYFASGINSDGEYLDFIAKFFCEKSGSWYRNDDWGMKVQGINGIMEFLSDKPDLYMELRQKVNDKLCQRNELDTADANMTEAQAESMTAEEKAWSTYAKEDEEEEDNPF